MPANNDPRGMPGTHFKGPLLGDRFAAGGLFKDAPIGLVAQRKWNVYFNDFVKASDAARFNSTAAAAATDAGVSDWVATEINTPTAATFGILNDSHLGLLAVNPGSKDASGIVGQLDGGVLGAGAYITLANDKTIIYEARLYTGAPTAGFFAWGLGSLDTSMMDSAGAITQAATGLQFYIADAATVAFVSTAGGTNTTSSSLHTPVIVTPARYGFRYTPTSLSAGTGVLEVYVNDVKVLTRTSGLPTTGVLAPYFGVINDTGNDADMFVDYVAIAVER